MDREPGLAGRKVVLTGATGGIGRAVARRLGAGGAELALIGRSTSRLAGLAEELTALAITCDLENERFVEVVAERITAQWEAGPDVLVNNAGAFELAPFVETAPAEFRRLLVVNLVAPFELTRLWLPGMLARGRGQIVNIGSVAGRRAFPGNAAYAASKFGLRGLHEVLVEELRGSGVRVCWIEPSAVDTPLWDRFEPERRPDLPSRTEMLQPHAVAAAVYFAVVQPPEVSVEEVVLRANQGVRQRGVTTKR